MSLKEYRRKRDFSRTPEPEDTLAAERGAEIPLEDGSTEGSQLCFVVQKHQASHLHYDFRLELDGVLLSWAVPKGPSLDPADRKLAIRTEDHPLSYRTFEGVIPKGEYGAGKVIVWDSGVYHAAGKPDRGATEEAIRLGLKKGRLDIVLDGEKLQGAFRLVRMGREERQWLLMKVKDEAASQQDVLLKDQSVLTGRTVEEVTSEATKPDMRAEGDIKRILPKQAQRGPMPHAVDPMLATLTTQAFSREGWLFEIKWDGFRAIAEVDGKNTRLYSRSQKDLSSEFQPVVYALKDLPFRAVLDGELVVVDDKGNAHFRYLQHYRKSGEGTLVFYVFDLLYIDGYLLTSLPLTERKKVLQAVLPDLPFVKYSDHIEREGLAFFRQAVKHDIEGMVAKDGSSHYREGVRSKEWLKVKTHLQQEAVIGGFTEPRGSRARVGALLLGVFEGNDFAYIGHAGGGFTETDLEDVYTQLEPLIRSTSPFVKEPPPNMPATWVEPELVCEVRFASWTNQGIMRQPIFLGIRDDRNAQDIQRERPLETEKALVRRYVRQDDRNKVKIEVEGHAITLTNLDKLYWPEDNLSKGDLIQYYQEMAPYLLPYLLDRPLNLHRFPGGIHGKGFFQKDVDYAPGWVRRETIESKDENGGEALDYLICQDTATLVYLGNLGTLELNPWSSRLGSLDYPDYLIVDIDPHGRSYSEVVQVAQLYHVVFDAMEAKHFLKTSGKSGLHIIVPLGARYTYAQARDFSKLVSHAVHQAMPEITSLERNPKQRKGKIYLDTLQNRWGQTISAPYSPRPRTGAPVSAPITWEELASGVSPLDFTMKNMRARVTEVGDLWDGVLDTKIDMEICLQRLQDDWGELVKNLATNQKGD